MSYTFNIIHLTNVICLLPTCTCTYTHIHHLHTSFHVRYVNYFVYKKQSSLPVPGLRTCVPFLPLLGIPCDLAKSFHVSEPLSPVWRAGAAPEKEPCGSRSSRPHPRGGEREEQGCVIPCRTMTVLTFLMPWQCEYSKQQGLC